MAFLEGETRQGEEVRGRSASSHSHSPFLCLPPPVARSSSLLATNDTRDDRLVRSSWRPGGKRARERRDSAPPLPSTPYAITTHHLPLYHRPLEPSRVCLEREKSCCLVGVHCVRAGLLAFPPSPCSHPASVTMGLFGFSAPPSHSWVRAVPSAPSLPFTRRGKRERERGRTEQAQETSTHTSPASPSNLY